jgi:hypothetical protein
MGQTVEAQLESRGGFFSKRKDGRKKGNFLSDYVVGGKL